MDRLGNFRLIASCGDFDHVLNEWHDEPESGVIALFHSEFGQKQINELQALWDHIPLTIVTEFLKGLPLEVTLVREDIHMTKPPEAVPGCSLKIGACILSHPNKRSVSV